VWVPHNGRGVRELPQFERKAGLTLGFTFCAHLGRADRKGRIERLFSYVDRNFLAGRSFNDFDDLNSQALALSFGISCASGGW
jgi:hypothetical protein